MKLFERFYGLSKEYFEGKGCVHTAGEIAHQPEMWRALSGVLRENKQRMRDFMGSVGSLRNVRIIVTGAGSSGFVGQAVAGFAAQSGGILCESIHTTDIVSAPDAYLADKPTLLISFARSGNSPESVGAVRYARERIKDLYEAAIVCDGGSKLSAAARESDKSLVLVMPEGTNDKGFAMTSSVSCMILAGFALLNPDRLDEIAEAIPNMADCVEKSGPAMSESARKCAGWGFERAWYLGSGPLTAIAREGALKMMELTNGAVVAGYNGAAEFRHGPKTVMNPKTLTLHFISNVQLTAKYDMDLLNQLYAEKDGNKVAALHGANESAPADMGIPYTACGCGFCGDICVGLQGLVFMQLLSMHTSLALGVTTDNPSPKGLVNRVVQGVTIY
jgi:tagatose-6-phosphate ketose/aldose isomerase